MICEVAEAGDEAATTIIEKAVHELVEHVRTLVQRLEPWLATPEVALAGGLIEDAGPLRLRVIQAIEDLPCGHRDHVVDGARGACALAMGLA